MWDTICILAWIGIPIAAMIGEFRHVANQNFTGVGCLSVPAWTFATVLGLMVSGWFTIGIFVLAVVFAAIPQSEERIADQLRDDRHRRDDLERQWRREERAEIEEDYRLGMIDGEEYDHQMRAAGFRPDED